MGETPEADVDSARPRQRARQERTEKRRKKKKRTLEATDILAAWLIASRQNGEKRWYRRQKGRQEEERKIFPSATT